MNWITPRIQFVYLAHLPVYYRSRNKYQLFPSTALPGCYVRYAVLLIWTDVDWHLNVITDKIRASMNERIFMKFDLSILRKSGEKIQI